MPTRVISVANLKVGDRVVEMRERSDAGITEVEAMRVHAVALRVVEIERTHRGYVNLRYEDGSGWGVLLPQVRVELVMTDTDLAELLAEARQLGDLKGRAAGTWAVDEDAPIETLRQLAQWIDDHSLLDHLEPVRPLSDTEADGYTVRQLLSAVGLGAPLAPTPDETAAFSNAVERITMAFAESYHSAYEAQAIDDIRAFLAEADDPDDDSDFTTHGLEDPLTGDSQPLDQRVPDRGDWIRLSSDIYDTTKLLEFGHDALGDTWITKGRLNAYRYQGYEGLVYATPEGLEVSRGEKGPTWGLPPEEIEFARDEIGLLTRKRKPA